MSKQLCYQVVGAVLPPELLQERGAGGPSVGWEGMIRQISRVWNFGIL